MCNGETISNCSKHAQRLANNRVREDYKTRKCLTDMINISQFVVLAVLIKLHFSFAFIMEIFATIIIIIL